MLAQSLRKNIEAADAIPLFVDMDGTLLHTDMLLETFVAALRSQPSTLIRAFGWFARGRSYLKQKLAELATVDVSTLPYNRELCTYLAEQARRGRRIYLATASDRTVAQAVADHLQCFVGVIASDGVANRKGRHKLAAIQEIVGDGPFDYAGNGPEDEVIWAAARGAIVAGNNAGLIARVERSGRLLHTFRGHASTAAALLRAMRPRQWLKNLLVLVPLFTSFSFFRGVDLLEAAAAFIAFSMVASATYIFNDLSDLATDRHHPRKRNRPFANGTAPIGAGIALAAALLVTGMLLGWFVSTGLCAMLMLYLAVTVAYSLRLKRIVLTDVLTLACLYTLRLFAGALALNIDVSVWLLAFSAFIFGSLALIKRCSELRQLQVVGETSTRGRDYLVADLPVLWSMGVASGMAAIVIFTQYITSPVIAWGFKNHGALWLVCPCLAYWLGRMWMKTSRGEMDDDPLVFTCTDRASQMCFAGIVLLFVVGRYGPPL